MRAAFILMLLLSLAIVGYALFVYTALPLGVKLHPDMRITYNAHRAAIYTHIFAALFALALGPLQFSARLRGRYPRLHRVLGRLYLAVGVLIGGSSGLYMARHAFGGITAQLGFALLALAWLATGFLAYRAIRRGDVTAHRRWMVRNFALAFAAVMLRLWIPGALAAGIPFESAYPPVAWLCWVPNLLFAEWLLRRKPHAVAAPPLVETLR